MKQNKLKLSLIASSFLLSSVQIYAQCTTPTLVTANPASICAPGGTTNLNASAGIQSISWYTVSVGGTPIGVSNSAANFNISAATTTTFYAESFISGVTTLNFTGAMQTYTAPATGVYTIETWGAQGGNDGLIGANGGYAAGVFTLTTGQTLNVFVGGAGIGCNQSSGGGWNGGGNAGNSGCSGGGGGASDIRFGGAALVDRILVAGGGGGAGNSIQAGAGGGLNGINGSGSGGTQTAGGAGSPAGSLGQGGNKSGDGGGGGGGYYGGGAAIGDDGGGGGSSYIGGISNGTTIAGNASMPNPTGGTMIGKTGNGVVKIYFPTCVSASRAPVVFSVNPLPTISASSGSICNGQSYTIVASGANTYTFQGGGPVKTPTTTTSYTVVGTSTAGCVSQSFATSTVTVNPTPTISVNSGAICAGQSFTMVASGANT